MPITVGIDVGGTKCLAVALDGTTLVDEAQVPTPVGAEALLDAMAGVALDVATGGARPTAVGVGVAGLVDRAGVLQFAPNLRGVDGLDVRAELERRLGLAVVVADDATCATWAERQMGAARRHGRRGGRHPGNRDRRWHRRRGPPGPRCQRVRRRGRPHGGREGRAGVPVRQAGLLGERFASGSGLGRLAREAAEAGRAGAVLELAGGDPEAVRGEHVSAAARAGDADACRVLGELGGGWRWDWPTWPTSSTRRPSSWAGGWPPWATCCSTRSGPPSPPCWRAPPSDLRSRSCRPPSAPGRGAVRGAGCLAAESVGQAAYISA